MINETQSIKVTLTNETKSISASLTPKSSSTSATLKDWKGEKGDQGQKGDPFTFEDFTPEQLEALRAKTEKMGLMATLQSKELITVMELTARMVETELMGKMVAPQSRVLTTLMVKRENRAIRTLSLKQTIKPLPTLLNSQHSQQKQANLQTIVAILH